MGEAFAVAGGQGAFEGSVVPLGAASGSAREIAAHKDTRAPDLSIVIPTLNAAMTLRETVQAIDEIRDVLRVEVIVVDGGSSDDTVDVAEALGLKVMRAARGRGSQLSAGAREAARPSGQPAP